MGNERLLLGNERLLLGIIGVFGFFGISVFVTGGFWDSVGRGGPVGAFENIYFFSLEKSKKVTQGFGSKIWASKIRSKNSGLYSGSGGATSLVQKFVPERLL